jgi:hypothetical protein
MAVSGFARGFGVRELRVAVPRHRDSAMSQRLGGLPRLPREPPQSCAKKRCVRRFHAQPFDGEEDGG